MSDSMVELHAAYVKSLNNKAQRLTEALSSRDFEAIKQLGHQMKGSGATYGFPEISEFGAQLEAAGEDRQSLVIESLIAEFKQRVTILQS